MEQPIDLISTESFRDGHPWEQYAWLRANDPVHWHAEADTAGFWAITKYDDIRNISRRPKLFSSYARGVMMGEADEIGLAAQRLMMLIDGPAAARPLQAAREPGLHAKNAQLRSTTGSRSWPATSSTTSSSGASATSCTTSPGGCRRP